jgi:hypothetical protein
MGDKKPKKSGNKASKPAGAAKPAQKPGSKGK